MRTPELPRSAPGRRARVRRPVSPSLSPDGRMVVYTRFWRGADTVHRRRETGNPEVQLAGDESSQETRRPNWSPKGDLIAFYNGWAQHYGLYVSRRLADCEAIDPMGHRRVLAPGWKNHWLRGPGRTGESVFRLCRFSRDRVRSRLTTRPQARSEHHCAYGLRTHHRGGATRHSSDVRHLLIDTDDLATPRRITRGRLPWTVSLVA